MHVDDKALEILDRKCRRLHTFAEAQKHREWLDELTPLLRWILSIPVLNAYVKQILGMEERSEAECSRVVKRTIRRLPRYARALRSLSPASTDGEDRGAQRLNWARFDEELENARLTEDPHQRGATERAMRILGSKADVAWEALNLGDGDQETPATRLIKKIYAEQETLTYALREREQEHATSPRTSLARLVDVIRALHPPHDDGVHWTDFLPRERFVALVAHERVKKDIGRYFERSAVDLARLVDELHVLGASTMSHRVVVERFKERCLWYDKARMRDIAADERVGRGTREDRLTLELAKYLHDNGLFVLVRQRVSNLEPDVVGLQGLAVEAKAYGPKSARTDIVHGYYQLHSYMTALETGAMAVHEGFVVAFRLDGPIYDTPRTLNVGRFLIHSMTIDLGDGSNSGRKQPRTETITEAEILLALKKQRPKKRPTAARARKKS
jgi:hypothetical protein